MSFEGKSATRDFFLRQKPRKPKEEIARYVEQNGFKVPKRFSDLASAFDSVKNGKSIIIRSEHPQDYAGASGILKSHVLSPESLAKATERLRGTDHALDWSRYNADTRHDPTGQTLSPDDMLDRLQVQLSLGEIADKEFFGALKKLDEFAIDYYPKIARLNAERFAAGVDYSVWEHIPGYNRTVVRDSAIPGRFHVFTTWNVEMTHPATGDTYLSLKANWTIVENGSVQQSLINTLPEDVQSGLGGLIDTYEKIRMLPNFDPTHCPLIEFQTSHSGENYFLQYLRTRDEMPAAFTLDRELEEGEFEAEFVRGITPPEGIIASTALYYPEGFGMAPLESAAFSFLYDSYFSEAMAPRRVAEVGFNALERLGAEILNGHTLKSTVFKPRIFVTSGKLREAVMESAAELYDQTDVNKKPARVRLRIISDGRKAYIKPLDPKFAALIK